MNTIDQKRSAAVDLVYIAISVVLIAVCSWISIPATIPFTLQTFAIFSILELIGGKRGTLSILVYILLAAVGTPVLAGFSGGPGAILGTTGGYILGFVFIGLLSWLGEKVFGTGFPVRIVFMILGLIVCYTFGSVWFFAVYSGQSGPIGIGTVFVWCVIPFIIPDMIKLALAVILAARVRRILHLQRSN